MRVAPVALLTLALTSSAVWADIRVPPPPPPPPPPGQGAAVAQVAAGAAAGLAVMGLGVWLARRRSRPVAVR